MKKISIEKLLNEVNKRNIEMRERNDGYDVLGIEFKKLRLEKNSTLLSYSGRICSQSYLSKIENNKIRINKAILEELCREYELTNEDVEKLLNSRGLLEDAINHFISDESDKIKALADDYHYTNYRGDLLRMLYYISSKQYDVANDYCNKVLEYVTSLSEFDFIFFSIISSSLMISQYKFKEAIDIVNDLDKYLLSDELKISRLMILFNANYALNDPSIIIYYNELEQILVRKLNIKTLEKIRYYLCLYFIKNKSFDAYSKYKEGISDFKYLSSLDVYYCFFSNQEILLPYDGLTDGANLIKNIACNRNVYLEEIDKRTNLYYDMDFDPLFIDYFKETEPAGKTNYILDRVLPILMNSHDGFLRNYFENELVNMDTPRRASNLMKFLSISQIEK